MTEAQPRHGGPRPEDGPAGTERATELLVEDQLCFALYSASRAITSCYRAALTATGLTYSQYLVMLVLWEEDRTGAAGASGSGLSLKAVGERLDLDNGTLSPLVKRLAAMGLVARRRSGTDERLLEVACTPAGSALYPRAVAAQAAVADATGMPRHEVAHLRETLLTLSSRLRAAEVPDASSGPVAPAGRAS